MKDKALSLLLFMVMKRNGDLKTKGVANGKYQKICMDKNEVSSPIPDINTLKYLCDIFCTYCVDIYPKGFLPLKGTSVFIAVNV